MPVYVVAYDLNKEVQRPAIVDEVKRTDWAMLSESSYAIETDEDPGQVHNRFRKYLDENDAFYVISLRQPYSGFGPAAVIDWLDDKLKW